jgi:hypothetical protein
MISITLWRFVRNIKGWTAKVAKVAKMPRGSKPGEHRGGRKPGTPNKRTTELVEVAKNALANAGRVLLDSPHTIVVLR